MAGASEGSERGLTRILREFGQESARAAGCILCFH